MGLLWMKPARDQIDAEIVTDLDALESKAIGFKFQGRSYVLQPISTGKLLEIYGAFGKIDDLIKKNSITADEVLNSYTDLFSSVCPEMDRETVGKMNQAQAAALFALIFDAVTGRVGKEKKSPLIPKA